MIEKTISSPNWTPRPRGINDVFGLVLHHTVSPGSSAIAVAKMFQSPSFGASAHDVVGDAGLVVHCVPIHRAAWHAGTCRRYDWDRDGRLEDWEAFANRHTIGIEICNWGNNRDDFPDIQIKTIAALIRRYDARCPNLKLRNITDHQTINLRGKIDMRPNFPAAKLFWYVIHPRTPAPSNVYEKLPAWAKHQVNEIKKD